MQAIPTCGSDKLSACDSRSSESPASMDVDWPVYGWNFDKSPYSGNDCMKMKGNRHDPSNLARKSLIIAFWLQLYSFALATVQTFDSLPPERAHPTLQRHNQYNLCIR